ncbi:MAG: hypothetical protein ACREJ2_14105 [Planctomycetota bacterium]
MGTLFVALISLIGAVGCFVMAKAADSNPWIWAVIGFFLPGLGLLLCWYMTQR